MSPIKCEHHPSYDPTNGEPREDVGYRLHHKLVMLPCPYCWQSYAKYLLEVITAMEDAIRKQHDKRRRMMGWGKP